MRRAAPPLATPLALLATPEGGLVAEQLHGVDRLSVAADQQADVLAVDIGVDLLVRLLDGHGRLEPELVDDALQENANSLCRLLWQHRLLRLNLSFGHAGSLSRA